LISPPVNCSEKVMLSVPVPPVIDSAPISVSVAPELLIVSRSLPVPRLIVPPV